MGLISHTDYVAGATITAAGQNANENAIVNEFNGNIENVNIKANAGIVDTKLAQITTSQKVNLSALVATSQAQGDVIYASSSTVMSRLGAGTAGQYLRTAGAAANPAWSTNFPIEGYSTGICILRKFILQIDAGGTPGTNITCSEVTGSGIPFNAPTITTATNLAKNASSGSFAFSNDGQQITLNVTQDIITCLSVNITNHDVKNSSVAAGDIFYILPTISSSNLVLSIAQTGTSSGADWTTVLTSAGDRLSVQCVILTTT